jgi:hypothetical protein
LLADLVYEQGIEVWKALVVTMVGLFVTLNGKYDTSNGHMGVLFGEDDGDDAAAEVASNPSYADDQEAQD